MYYESLNIKIDEKIDDLFKAMRELGATEELPELISNLIQQVALPKIFENKKSINEFIGMLKTFIEEKAYDTESKYYVPLVILEELDPIKELIEEKKATHSLLETESDKLTDENLVQVLIYFCACMFELKFNEIVKEFKPTLH